MCQEMVSPILGALLPPPMELDEDDDILPPQAVKRPAENVPLDINLIAVFKDVSERSTLFEFGTWVDVTCSKYFHVLQISRIHFNLKEKICGIALPSSSFFIFWKLQPTNHTRPSTLTTSWVVGWPANLMRHDLGSRSDLKFTKWFDAVFL